MAEFGYSIIFYYFVGRTDICQTFVTVIVLWPFSDSKISKIYIQYQAQGFHEVITNYDSNSKFKMSFLETIFDNWLSANKFLWDHNQC